jgi:predicted dehydrogenase
VYSNAAPHGSLIRWGILGTGPVAAAFAGDLSLVPGVTLSAVCSRQLERGRLFAQSFGARHVHTSTSELVQNDDVDVIYVATPPARHYDDCLRCLSAGRAVLCEKPFALNAAQARSVAHEARARRLFCMEAMWMRFHPLVLKLRQLVQSGELGSIRLLTAEFGYSNPSRLNDWRFDPMQGGGALLDCGVYPISLAFFLLGKPSAVVGRATIGPSGVDELMSVVLTYADGALATLTASLKNRLTNEAVITGSTGRIHIHEPFYAPHRITLTRYSEATAHRAAHEGVPHPSRLSRFKRNPLLRRIFNEVGRPVMALLRRNSSGFMKYAPGQGYQYEAAEVVRCMRSGEHESSVMPLSETVAILEATDALRESWASV